MNPVQRGQDSSRVHAKVDIDPLCAHDARGIDNRPPDQSAHRATLPGEIVGLRGRVLGIKEDGDGDTSPGSNLPRVLRRIGVDDVDAGYLLELRDVGPQLHELVNAARSEQSHVEDEHRWPPTLRHSAHSAVRIRKPQPRRGLPHQGRDHALGFCALFGRQRIPS